MKNILQKIKSNYKSWLTVSMISLPLSISLAVASWATPLQWILTWIWAWVFAFFYSSSNYNIFWVAWALSSILFWFTLSHWELWVSLLPVIAIISWFLMLIIYFLKITKYITLIPTTALHWFLISVWITIALWQISWALWLNDPLFNIPQHKEIFLNLLEISKNIIHSNIYALIVFLFGFWFLIICKKYFPKFPWVIVLTILWIILWFLVEYNFFPHILLIVDKYPSLTFSLFENPFRGINFNNFNENLNLITWIFSISLVVSIIAIIETIISAKIAENITKVKFNKDKEVLWLAISNLWTGLMWWLPNTAVFIRTALNINSWANHKMSWLLTSIFTLIISALAFNWAFKYLPFPIISAILMNIAIWLIDIKMLKNLYKIQKTAFVITLITTFFSVFWEPTYWILIWTSITLLIFLKKMTNQDANISIFRKDKFVQKITLWKYLKVQQDSDIVLMKFSSGLTYLNIETNISKIEKINKNQKVILSLSHIWNIDIDWIETIDEIINILTQNNIDVYLSWIETCNYYSKLHNYNLLKKNNKVFATTWESLNILLNK